jgi:uncharacterized membrane protein YkoI
VSWAVQTSDDGKDATMNKVWRTWAGVGVLATGGLAGAAVAAGAGSSAKTATTTTAASTTVGHSGHAAETPLTGDVLAEVTAAAIAKAGGTVDAATTETVSSNPAAAYEAHVTKSDGTHVTVILDKDANVLGVETGRGPHGDGRTGHGGPGNGETALTGDVAAKAKAAAVAEVGGTADSATTETDGTSAAAAYEVHVTKSDGTRVTVILDKADNVLTVETRGDGGPGDGPHR